MRLATVLWNRKPTLAVALRQNFLNLPGCVAALKKARRVTGDLPPDMLELIAGGASFVRVVQSLIRAAVPRLRDGIWQAKARDPLLRPMDRVRVLAPIPRPRKNIFCLGRNYAAHAKERQAEVPTIPVFFTKPPTSVIGHDGRVIHHPMTAELDYEVELAVVVGRRGINIPRARAYEYVFGYTILIDVTARDVQKRHMQWFKGKGLDTFCPMGPWIVHKSAIPDPHDLNIGLRVNGEIRQAGHTGDMVFKIPDLIEVLSAGMTLEPGDILATGTPSGVAAGRDPPRWLKAGDVIEAEIEGIGVLRNRVADPRS